MSLGRAWVHDFEGKIHEASAAGFEGIEIFYEDLEYLAKSYGDTGTENLVRAAEHVRNLCSAANLTIICLQPFLFFGGLVDRGQHAVQIERLKVWFKLLKALGINTMQIPTNFQAEGVSGDLDLIVQDLTEAADLGLGEDPPIRMAYEAMAWGRFVETWEAAWEVILRVNRPNFGCCLDAFNLVGRVWADPTSPTGKTENADADLKASLDRLVKAVDVKKVFYVQVADAERISPPLTDGHPFHVDGQAPRMSWSRNARLFVYETEKGGYLPVIEVARVILKELKFEGWVSMELFSRTMADPDPSVPHTHAQRAIKGWKKMVEELDL